MLNILKAKLNESDRTAQVVDGKLILSFPRAKTPILWQMDLGNIKISALEIQTLEDDHVLVLKNPKGETVTIATFEDKGDAVDHLIEISGALGKAQGRIQSAANENKVDVNSRSKTGGWLKRLAIVVLVFALLFMGLGYIASQPIPAGYDAGAVDAPSNDGQPMSADDFLRGY